MSPLALPAGLPVIDMSRGKKITSGGQYVSTKVIFLSVLMFASTLALLVYDWYYSTALNQMHIAAPMFFGFVLLLYDSIGG